MATETSQPEPRVSLITLGVTDFQKSLRFYEEGLGWKRSNAGSGESAFFQIGGTILSLYPRAALAEDAGVVEDSADCTFHGFTLAHNVRTREEVDRVLAYVRQFGGKIVKDALDAFWGGRSGYFADPDGFLWEVAWNPGFPVADDGSISLP